MSRLTDLPEAESLALSPGPRAEFNFRVLGGRVLLTNATGRHVELSKDEFRAFVEDRLPAEGEPRASLAAGGFLADAQDRNVLKGRYRSKNRHLWRGPGLHILVVSLRCNHRCLYCHASVVGESRTDLDMSLETAKQAVDFIFQSPSPSLLIEFQGGEPLLNWPVIRFVTRYAAARARWEGRSVAVSLVSNFSLMDEEKFRFLVDHGVYVCTSLDGPEDLHNRIRLYRGGNSYAEVVRWIGRFQELADRRAKGSGRHDRPGALMTVTRESFGRSRDIVDAYLSLKLPSLFIRPLSPIGFARRVWDKIGYGPDEFLAFYRETLEIILEWNRCGVRFVEQGARVHLTKILGQKDPGFVDLRSPAGGGLGVLAYNYNGDVYTGDEGRMLAQEGNEFFRLGRVSQDYNEVIGSAKNRECLVSSTLEAQPWCSECAYQPYCGVCPAYNVEMQGSPWGHMPSNGRCRTYMGIFDTLFEKLRDPEARKILESWARPDPL